MLNYEYDLNNDKFQFIFLLNIGSQFFIVKLSYFNLGLTANSFFRNE